MATAVAPERRTRSSARRLEPDPRLAHRLAACSLLALVATVAAYLLFVRTVLGQRFDQAAYDGAVARDGFAGRASTSLLQRITGDSLAVVLAVIVVIGLARRRPLLGLGAAFAAGAVVVVTDLLREHVLQRPALIANAYPVGNSFPSGHTAAAVACAMALVLVSPPRWRGLAAVVAGAYGWLTAAEVQTAGWHRPSDALGAALLAFAAVTAVAAALARFRPVRRFRWGRHLVAQGILGLVALADAVFLVVVGSRVVHRLSQTATPTRVHDAYLVGVGGTVEVVVVLLMVLLALLSRVDLDGRGWGRD